MLLIRDRRRHNNLSIWTLVPSVYITHPHRNKEQYFIQTEHAIGYPLPHTLSSFVPSKGRRDQAKVREKFVCVPPAGVFERIPYDGCARTINLLLHSEARGAQIMHSGTNLLLWFSRSNWNRCVLWVVSTSTLIEWEFSFVNRVARTKIPWSISRVRTNSSQHELLLR